MKKLESKIQHRLHDFHFKVALLLCTMYDVILVPTFEVSQMVKLRKLHSTAKRHLLLWQHYKFRKVIKDTAERMGKKMILVDESYTSKTCGSCFKINEKLGSSKKFNCPNCSCNFDRDVNGARNILVRAMYAAHTGQSNK